MLRIPLILLAAMLLVLSVPIGVTGQSTAKLVAKPYPGAVPEESSGKSSQCGDNKGGYCFLTRDSVEKVKAFYQQQGITLQSLPVEEVKAVGGGISNFEQALRLQLESYRLGMIDAAPLEFYQTRGADDEPSYFNGVVVMTRKPGQKLGGDAKANLRVLLDDPVYEQLTADPQAAALRKGMGDLQDYMQLETAQLAEQYNQHLSLAGAYFRVADGRSVPQVRLGEARERRAAPPQAASSDTSQAVTMEELNTLLKRKLEKQSQVRAVRMKMTMQKGAKDQAGQQQSQAELDQILMSDPELADWKRRRDGAPQQRAESRVREEKESQATKKAHEADLKNPEKLRADVHAYLTGLEKDAYFTRILIHASGGNRVKRDRAVVQKEWNAIGMGQGK